jgi:hypothetical protein
MTTFESVPSYLRTAVDGHIALSAFLVPGRPRVQVPPLLGTPGALPRTLLRFGQPLGILMVDLPVLVPLQIVLVHVGVRDDHGDDVVLAVVGVQGGVEEDLPAE